MTFEFVGSTASSQQVEARARVNGFLDERRYTEGSIVKFENIILRAENQGAALVRLKNVGRADLGRKDYSIRSKYQGKNATLLAVYQQPGAIALQVSQQVRQTLETLSKSFPDGLKYDVALDTTKFVKASIDEVILTFFEAVVLVVLVVFVFLHSLRLTVIPTLAVPVSILGTFIGMLLFGFSINMLTLFGMILAIGIVVNDAIVVVENTERNMSAFGLSPKEAAKRAKLEVSVSPSRLGLGTIGHSFPSRQLLPRQKFDVFERLAFFPKDEHRPQAIGIKRIAGVVV